MSLIQVFIRSEEEGLSEPVQTNMAYDPALLPEGTDQKEFFITSVLRLKELHEQKVEEELGAEETAQRNREKFEKE